MLKIFRFLNKPYRVREMPSTGRILSFNLSSMKEIEKIYEEYRDKSIKEGIYYLKGSNYMKEMMEKYPNPDIFNEFFLPTFDRIDSRSPSVPLEIGELMEAFQKNPNIRLGIHRSGAIRDSNPLEDETLQSIMRDGLINNGAAMQGLVTPIVQPSQTISNAADPIMAIPTLKSSFRGSTGAVLIGLPKAVVDVNMDFIDPIWEDILYNVDSHGVHYIKPEYILGYLSCKENDFHFYSRDEILSFKNKKEH